MVLTRSQTKWLETGRIGRPAWTPSERNAAVYPTDPRKTVEQEAGNKDEVASKWKSLYRSAQAELEQQQRKMESLLSCLQKVDSERNTAQEVAESRHQEALEWRKQCEAAQCEARSAASMAEKREKDLHALEELVVKKLLTMDESRVKAVKAAEEARSLAGAAVQRATCAEQREQAALQREMQMAQEADECEAREEQSKAECEKLRKAWESAKALLLAAQQQQQQETLHSHHSAPQASAAQGSSSSAAAGAESWSQMDPATRLLKHQLAEKDYTIKKLQQELQDMRRVAAQVAAERQAATPLPPIAPRPRKRCRSDELEADMGLSASGASDGGVVQRTQSAQATSSASSGPGPAMQQRSGAPATTAASQASTGTPETSPVQGTSSSGEPASAATSQAASGTLGACPVQNTSSSGAPATAAASQASTGTPETSPVQDASSSGAPATAAASQAASGAPDACPVQNTSSSGAAAAAAASQAALGAPDACPVQNTSSSGAAATAAASQASTGSSDASQVQDIHSNGVPATAAAASQAALGASDASQVQNTPGGGAPASAAASQAASGASDASPVQDPSSSAKPPCMPQGIATQEPPERTCPIVSNINPRLSGDTDMPDQQDSAPAVHSGTTPEVATSMNEERPSVTPTAAEQGSQPGAPGEQSRRETLHRAARELLLGEEFRRFVDSGCKGKKTRKRDYDERKAIPLPPSKLHRGASSADTGEARLASAHAEQGGSSEASEGASVPCNSAGIAQHCSTASSPMAQPSRVPSSPLPVLPEYCRTGGANEVCSIGLAH